MCIVILRMRWCNGKQAFPADRVYCNTIATQLNANVIIENTPSCKDSNVPNIANPTYAVISSNGNKTRTEIEYGVVNQPKCNDTDYEITHGITIHTCTYATQQTDKI